PMRLLLSSPTGHGRLRYLPSFPTRRSSDLCGCWILLPQHVVLDVALALKLADEPDGHMGTVASRDDRVGAHSSEDPRSPDAGHADRKSTRLNSSHVKISYAVFCLKKKTPYI